MGDFAFDFRIYIWILFVPISRFSTRLRFTFPMVYHHGSHISTNLIYWLIQTLQLNYPRMYAILHYFIAFDSSFFFFPFKPSKIGNIKKNIIEKYLILLHVPLKTCYTHVFDWMQKLLVMRYISCHGNLHSKIKV